MENMKPATQSTNILPNVYKKSHFSHPIDPRSGTMVGDQSMIILFVLGMAERIDFARTPVVTLGRFDADTKASDQLDLTGYRAVERGVSRQHCQLEFKDNRVVITDLGSSNGTYVTGKRLEPHQPYVLEKGEELILGRLPIQVMTGR